MQNRPFLVLLVSCLLAILPLPSSLAADGYLTAAAAIVTTPDIPELFVPDDGPTQQSRSKAAATLAGRYPVRINAWLSETGLPPATVLLSAPNGARYEVVQDNQILHASGGTTWVGHLKDHDDIYRVLVTTQQGHSFGRILTPDGEFLVESDDSGTWLLDTHEAGWLPANTYDDAIPSPSLASSRQLAPHSDEATVTPTDSSISPKAAGNSIIDVMLLYTPDLATHYGAGLQARLDSLIATANQAYLDSQVNISLRLVHHAQVSYSETASNTDALDALTYGSHPSLANVSAWRDQYGADLVALLRPFSMANHVGCGLSWLNGFNGQAMNAAYGFSVIGDGSDVGGSLYYCPDSSLVHELGHAMGSDHDRAHSVAQGAYPYAYGYGIEGVFGTIMSYINPRVGKFSNPNINCLGNHPCGIEDYADNTRSLNNTRDSVAGFRNANANSDQIVLALEEPVGSTTYSGVANIRGWAVAPQGVQRIELYLDGALWGNIPLGGRRADVGDAYPGYPGSADSGFAMAFNYSTLSAGPHTLTVRAVDAAEATRDASAAFTVTRFANAYVADPAAVSLDQATLSRTGNVIAIQNLMVEGQPYAVHLAWRPATQGFAIDQIEAAQRAAAADLAASAMPAAANVVLALEEPVGGTTYSGVANIRGWAVAPQGVQRIELYLDGALWGNIPLGGRRADVGDAYPGYPGSADSGFAMAFNYSTLSAGPHTLTVRAVDAAEATRDASAAFTVTRFANAYVADPAAVSLDQATLSRTGNVIAIQNLMVEGQPYAVHLAWRPATQGFAVSQIDR